MFSKGINLFQEELRNLMDLVKRVSGEVRDNVRMLDRTRVCMIVTNYTGIMSEC